VAKWRRRHSWPSRLDRRPVGPVVRLRLLRRRLALSPGCSGCSLCVDPSHPRLRFRRGACPVLRFRQWRRSSGGAGRAAHRLRRYYPWSSSPLSRCTVRTVGPVRTGRSRHATFTVAPLGAVSLRAVPFVPLSSVVPSLQRFRRSRSHRRSRHATLPVAPLWPFAPAVPFVPLAPWCHSLSVPVPFAPAVPVTPLSPVHRCAVRSGRSVRPLAPWCHSLQRSSGSPCTRPVPVTPFHRCTVVRRSGRSFVP